MKTNCRFYPSHLEGCQCDAHERAGIAPLTYYTVTKEALHGIYDCAKQIQILPTPYTGDDLQMAKAAVAQAKRVAQTIINLIPENARPNRGVDIVAHNI